METKPILTDQQRAELALLYQRLTEAFEAIAGGIVEAVNRVIEILAPLLEKFSRAWLFVKIFRAGWPVWVARRVSHYCPKRWLPGLHAVF